MAAAVSSAPLARPVTALLPPSPKATVDVSSVFVAIPADEAYAEIIQRNYVKTIKQILAARKRSADAD